MEKDPKLPAGQFEQPVRHPEQPEKMPLPERPGVVEPIIAAGEMVPPPVGSPTDVLGSYTGRPADGGVPVQDADDL